MDTMLLEIFVIMIMILLNGFFSCSEFAIVSVRKSRIAQLLEDGDPRAVMVDELQRDPHRLLAVVQIGVTVAGSMASTVGGIVAVESIKPLLAGLPWPAVRHAAEPLAVMTVVAVVSYTSLIIGELVPKAIGLQYADSIALHVARPLTLVSRIASIAVTILTVSSKTLLRMLHIATEREPFITREELQHVVSEGEELGVISPAEKAYIRNVFEFTHTCVREVMVPRTRIVALDLDTTKDEAVRLVLENMYSRYPVYRGEIEEIVGIVHGKDLLGRLVAGKRFDIAAIMHPLVFVPESKKVNDLLTEMQRHHGQMAIVVDEYGGLSGLVTSEDLIEELLGEIRDEHDTVEPADILTLPGGVLIVEGLLPVFDLSEHLGIKPEEHPPYDTVAGLILHELGSFPQRGESVEWQGFRLICEEVTRTSILKVRIVPTTGGMIP